MIPKKIHYCWFGRGEKPENVIQCMESWRRYLSDYEIVEWNEDNFDINCNLYVRQAYDTKKYAFVSDYVRMYALYNYGGIYFDTDVEAIKNIDSFLNFEGFIGFENDNWLGTAVIGLVPNNEIIKIILDSYKYEPFIKENDLDLLPNTVRVTAEFDWNYGIQRNGEKQQVGNGNFIIYPQDYFCANNWKTHEKNITNNTYTVHHFNASWFNKE